jgi:hypothetical protein
VASLRLLDYRVQPSAAWFIRQLQRAGIQAVITSTRRDEDQQRELYECFRRTGCSNCRRGPGCYPAAPPGRSWHDRGLAFDLKLTPRRYREAGALWERLGGTWGGRFGDEIHFDARRMGS